MSGWMLMGMPFAVYLAGFSAVWIAQLALLSVHGRTIG